MSEFKKKRRAEARRVTEAADWFLLLREDDVGETQLAAWFEWCSDPENLKEFQTISGVWRGFGPSAPVSGAAAIGNPTTSLLRPRRGPPVRRLAWAASLAGAAVALATVATWPLMSARNGYRANAVMRSDDLPDGSRVTLAPRSALSVDFSQALRRVSMPSGEVFFRVHPDKTKPFVVNMGDVSVTAVGTAFDVKADAEKIVVTVQEGIVDVSPQPSGSAATPWRITRGSQLVYDRASKSVRIASVEADRVVAWQSGRLEYVAIPLSQVVADVSRYSPRSVEIGDPRLASLTFTGAVLTDSVEDWLAAIQSTFPIRVVTAQDGHWVLIGRTG